MEKVKILLVEDDPNLGQILSEYLVLKGFDTTLRQDGEAGLMEFNQSAYTLCILDLMMPKKDGFTLATEIRQKRPDTPIIFLTAKSMQEDILQGFKIGADDYITKPFSMEELVMRIRAVLRRSKVQDADDLFPDEYTLGGIRYLYKQNLLHLPSGDVKLTTKENELLKLFFQNLNKTVDRSNALLKIWKDDSYFNARSMDVYIAKLRKYLKEEPCVQILTVHGEGFRMVKVA
jgi:two-component system, OmpR family, response regulator VicR